MDQQRVYPTYEVDLGLAITTQVSRRGFAVFKAARSRHGVLTKAKIQVDSDSFDSSTKLRGGKGDELFEDHERSLGDSLYNVCDSRAGDCIECECC
jgi:hypothetical protein